MQNSGYCIKGNVQKSCQNSANLGAIARFLFPFLKLKGRFEQRKPCVDFSAEINWCEHQ